MNVLTGLFFLLGRMFSFDWLDRIVFFVKRMGNLIYSGYVSAKFKSADGRMYIEYPMILIGAKYMEIGKGFFTRGRLRIEAYDKFNEQLFTPLIQIGDNTCFNYDCHIGCIDKIVIGNNVLIGSRVLIIDHSHGNVDEIQLKLQPDKRPLVSKGPVIIEDNVWIGEGAVILPNCTIGKNSVIAANAVVSKSIPPNSLAAGIPARVIKTLG